MSIIQIDSNKRLDHIEHHFKVSAGPGAGKTHWLVEHIRNVLHHSNRLGKIRKISCITYTNIAVETILARLGTSATQVDVSTIHSFLYRHIVKPYAFLIADEYNLDYSKLDGHDELNHSYSKINNWLELTNQKYFISEQSKLIDALDSVQWQLQNDGEIYLQLPATKAYLGKITKLYIKKASYIDYRRQHWLSGKIHHDDVLFFSYQLITKFPYILEVIRAKFPYFFIDEFQDCNPIQLAIIKKIAESETIIGVIGDPAQSIYEFQGAVYTQFNSFSLPNIKFYEMNFNNRSTIQIINVLNKVRSDITQISVRQIEGNLPTLLIGNQNQTIQAVKKCCGDSGFCSLSRLNIDSNVLKSELDSNTVVNNLFDRLVEDSNQERRKILAYHVKAIELAREKKFKDSFKELSKIFPVETFSLAFSLTYLSNLLSEYDDFKDKSLSHFIEIIRQLSGLTVAKLQKGRAKELYDNHIYNQISICVNIPDDTTLSKTIHKSKGDEFDNVVLFLKSENDLEFITNPNLMINEEHRINYVAISRAKYRLFISVPSLDTVNEPKFSEHFEIVRC
ncbi:TPA: UvrD-helicase domain-containing protein [Acinetobacter baumannii]|uniref:ATP-dependent helicase n=1 Tax=Acinetobacter nosocomialis TaxID=106654 RepID=UPI00245893D9|nr:ATP-dependent helicase [Acinetobacter nosocomialis]